MIEKKLTLCQHLDIDYFKYSNKYYIQNTQEGF